MSRESADDLREALAEALNAAAHWCQHDPCTTCTVISDEAFDAMIDATAMHGGTPTLIQGKPGAIADALLPLVTAWAESLARERAAEELTRTAKFLWSRGFDTSGGLVATRAADLIGPIVAAALTADDQPVQP